MKNIKETFAARLKQKLEMKGITNQELAYNIGVSKQVITEYLNAKSLPLTDKQKAIAKFLNTNINFFFNPIKYTFSKMEYRAKESMLREYEKKMIESTVKYKVENYIYILEKLKETPTIFNLSYNVDNESQIKLAAEKLREEWKLGKQPISSLTELIESKGILLVYIKTRDKFDGVSGFLIGNPPNNTNYPYIAIKEIDKDTNKCRLRFSLAHELAHLYLNIQNTNVPKTINKYCDTFASEFLLPESELLEEVKSMDFSKFKELPINLLLNIQYKWGISVEAIVYKLNALKLITRNQYEKFWMWHNKDENQNMIKKFGYCNNSEISFTMKNYILAAKERGIIQDWLANELLTITAIKEPIISNN